jgi:hypothetical protein
MHIGENIISFKISSDGKVELSPEMTVQSTSHEMQEILGEIAPKVANYMEALLRERFEEKG